MITKEEFILEVQGAPISNGDLYVHFDDTSNSILGVAIHNTTVNSVNILDVLRQVEQVRFTLTKGSSSQLVTLQVTGKSTYPTFIHCEVTPFPLQVSLGLLDNDVIPYTISNVEFSPAILLEDYYNSDYNAVHNNVLNQQTSRYLQVAERDRLVNIPTNLDALLSDTAQKAQIPDSNYTVKGWIQARYLGSVTGAASYGTIPGALAGSTFIGSLHSPVLATGSICALSTSDRVLETFIHTGTQEFPTFELGKRFRIATSQILNASDTVLNADLANTSISLTKYDLLLVSSSLTQEILRVLDYSAQSREIIVERGVGYTTPATYSPGSFDIFPIIRNQIFRVEDNKAVALTDSWIWIKDSLSLVLTDKHGIVYREAACPEIIYFRPQG